MKTSSRLVLATTLVALAALPAFTTGCNGQVDEEKGSEEETDTNPSKVVFTSEGLTIEAQSPDRVAGTFEREGVTVRFALTNTNGVHSFVLNAAQDKNGGEELIASTYENGIDSAVYFGGKAQATGVIDAEPTKSGDAAVFDQLTTRSEMKLVPLLKEALVVKGIDRSLFAPDRAAEQHGGKGITPQGYSYNGWMHLLGNGDYYSFWSWSFWGTTTVVMANGGDVNQAFGGVNSSQFNYGRVEADVRAGAGFEHVAGNGVQTIRRQWWGALVTVTNRIPPTIYLSGCTTQWVQIATQCSSNGYSTICQPVYGPKQVCSAPRPNTSYKLLVQNY